MRQESIEELADKLIGWGDQVLGSKGDEKENVSGGIPEQKRRGSQSKFERWIKKGQVKSKS